MTLDVWLSDGLTCVSACLSSEEQARAQRFIHEQDRQTFTQAHLLKRLLCTHYCPQLPPEEWEFRHHNGGKPYALPPFPYAFNLSHSRPCLAVAIANNEVGVDIEPHRYLSDLDQLADTALRPREKAWLRRQPSAEQGFLRLWTMKEAIVKAAATGFSVHPLEVECRQLDAPPATAILKDQQWRCWTHSQAQCSTSVAIPDGDNPGPAVFRRINTCPI